MEKIERKYVCHFEEQNKIIIDLKRKEIEKYSMIEKIIKKLTK